MENFQGVKMGQVIIIWTNGRLEWEETVPVSHQNMVFKLNPV